MSGNGFTLPADVLARVVGVAGLGRPHVTLVPAATWVGRGAERGVDERAGDLLAAAGLVGRRGGLTEDAVTTFTLLCAARVEFYGWIARGERTTGVLVAASGRHAVLATRDDHTVHIRRVAPTGLADLLAAQTPDVPAGRGRSITVTADDLRPRRPGHTVAVRRVSPELALARRIADLPTTGGGELHTAIRTSTGERFTPAHPVRYADSVHGRWSNTTVPGPAIVVAPADSRTLAAKLRAAQRELAPHSPL